MTIRILYRVLFFLNTIHISRVICRKHYHLKERDVEDKLSQALNRITYTSFPTVNKGTIAKLQNIIGNISRIEYNISTDHTILLKPVEIVDETKYYELYYFHGRKDTASIYVKTELNMEDYVDEDDFLLALVNRKELDASEINSITEVNEIDKRIYCDMT